MSEQTTTETVVNITAIKMTEAQKEKATEYRETIFSSVTSKAGTDSKKAAEAAICILIGGKPKNGFIWADNPEDALTKRREVLAPIEAFLGINMTQLRKSLGRVKESLNLNLFHSASKTTTLQMVMEAESVLHNALQRRLEGKVLADVAKDSEGFSFCSYREAKWIAKYAFLVDEGIMTVGDSEREILSAFKELLHHCFAVHILMNEVVIVTKPKSVDIESGRVKKIKF